MSDNQAQPQGDAARPQDAPKPLEKLRIETKESFKTEQKDFKIEKVEKIEAKEHKDLKQEKIEKNEAKEHKDSKHEKIEKPEKQIGKEKDGKEISEGPGTNPGDPIEQRIGALEQNVATMQHFITSAQRPDLSQGALSGETKPRSG